MICAWSLVARRDKRGGNSSLCLWVAKNERERESISLSFYLRAGFCGSTDSRTTSQCLEVSRLTGEHVCIRTQLCVRDRQDGAAAVVVRLCSPFAEFAESLDETSQNISTSALVRVLVENRCIFLRK